MPRPTPNPLAEIGLLLYGPGNQSSLAAALGISLSTLQRLMRQGGQGQEGQGGDIPDYLQRRLWSLLQHHRDKIDLALWLLTKEEVERELDNSELEEDKEGKFG